MADSTTERVRRARRHKRGDHSLCRREHCLDAAAAAMAAEGTAEQNFSGVRPSSVDAVRVLGGIETAVAAFVASLSYEAGDPRALLGQIAVQLGRRIDETSAMPAAVRELRVLLSQLAEVPNQPWGELDVIRVRSHQRRLDNLLRQAEYSAGAGT